jgi:uncharacterized protein (DUF488 family)
VVIWTIGFTKRTAEDFFETLRGAEIQRLLDIRLNNSSQLAGFTKKEDLKYFLREICQADYQHEPTLAPTDELLRTYKKEHGSWDVYEAGFLDLMRSRRIDAALDPGSFDRRTVLLCSEFEPDHCHRRLVAEYLARHWANVQVIHL